MDARSALGFATRARLQFYNGNWSSAIDLFRQALAIDPEDFDVEVGYCVMLASLGHVHDSLQRSKRVMDREKLLPGFKAAAALLMNLNGQYADAIAILVAIPQPNPLFLSSLASAYAPAGRFADSAKALLAMQDDTNVLRREVLEAAADLMRRAPATAAAPEALPRLDVELSFVYAHVGAYERVLESPERLQRCGVLAFWPSLWEPLYAPVRKTERFKAYVRAAGLVDYWREHGWPDLCRPVGEDDVCG